jgi:hypothetical protein
MYNISFEDYKQLKNSNFMVDDWTPFRENQHRILQVIGV